MKREDPLEAALAQEYAAPGTGGGNGALVISSDTLFTPPTLADVAADPGSGAGAQPDPMPVAVMEQHAAASTAPAQGSQRRWVPAWFRRGQAAPAAAQAEPAVEQERGAPLTPIQPSGTARAAAQDEHLQPRDLVSQVCCGWLSLTTAQPIYCPCLVRVATPIASFTGHGSGIAACLALGGRAFIAYSVSHGRALHGMACKFMSHAFPFGLHHHASCPMSAVRLYSCVRGLGSWNTSYHCTHRPASPALAVGGRAGPGAGGRAGAGRGRTARARPDAGPAAPGARPGQPRGRAPAVGPPRCHAPPLPRL